MASKRQNKKIILIGGVVFFIVIVFSFIRVSPKKQISRTVEPYLSPTVIPSPSISNQYIAYESHIMKIKFQASPDFQVKDQQIRILLDKYGELVIIEKVGTNFTNINDYLDDLSSKNQILITDREYLKINQLDTLKAIIKHPISKSPDNRVYFFYKDNSVYDISTTFPSLYSDLDQVAGSFRFAP